MELAVCIALSDCTGIGDLSCWMYAGPVAPAESLGKPSVPRVQGKGGRQLGRQMQKHNHNEVLILGGLEMTPVSPTSFQHALQELIKGENNIVLEGITESSGWHFLKLDGEELVKSKETVLEAILSNKEMLYVRCPSDSGVLCAESQLFRWQFYKHFSLE